jgi:hypothetical protein
MQPKEIMLMKKLLMSLILPLFFLSCISSGVTVTVNKDGSGELVQTFKIIREFVGFLSVSEEPTDPNLIDMEALKLTAESMGEGVRLIKVEPMPEDTLYAGYLAYFEFDDISRIRVSAAPSTSPEAASEENSDWISFDFDKGGTSTLTLYLEGMMDDEDSETHSSEDEDELEASTDEGLGEQLKEIYKDMHYWMKFKVNGKITDTNAAFVDNSTITVFDMNFEKIVENDELFKRVTNEEQGSMIEYKEELSAAGVFIDDQPEIVVSFK